MAARVDSVQLLQAKFSGCLAAADLAGAKDLIAAGSGLLDDDARNGMLAVIAAREHRWDEAIELTEPFYRANPIDPGICNDLSWYLACAGRDLERAEYLVRTSIALSGRRSTSDNTLAVVLLRQGRADEALKMLSDLQDDDRPSVQVTNGYFVGLCHWLEGEREEAVTVWRSLAGIAPRDPFAHLARESLTMAEAGEDPAWVYLRAPVAEAGSAGER
jgi:Flp pilus assembly protein TadD